MRAILSILWLAVLCVGCAGNYRNAAAQSEDVKDPAAGPGQILINGAGATFPYPIYSKWFDQYHRLFPNVQINYQSIGSGGGIRQLLQGTVDFGASDSPMSDAQLSQAQTKILHFPAVLGADVAVYNIPGFTSEINFTPAALAGIFLGRITRWNDTELKNANPGLNLPDRDIVVVHRSDGSGTTYVWVDYLAKISPEWNEEVGVDTSVEWPAGLGGKGNEGVAGLMKQVPYSIGYVELVYAIQNKMSFGRVRNASGNFVKADLQSLTAAAASVAKEMPQDFRVSITNAPGETVYPISSFTWLLVPAHIPDEVKRKTMKDFLAWMIDDGQNMVEALSYARLPQEVIAMERKALSEIE